MSTKREQGIKDNLSPNLIKSNRLDVQHAAKKCWTGLLKCTRCRGVVSHYGPVLDYAWALQLFCDQCMKTHYICTICEKNKKIFVSTRELEMHQSSRTHQKKEKSAVIALKSSMACVDVEEQGQDTSVFGEDSFDFDTEIMQDTTVLSSEAESYLKENNLFYFISRSEGKGNEYLFSSTYFPSQNAVTKVTANDSKFNILFGNFLYSLSKSMKESFANILALMEPYMLPSYKELRTPYSLNIPFQASSLRATYSKGINSLKDNLPLPKLTKVYGKSENDTHSYVSLLECLSHFMAFGNSVVELSKTRLKGQHNYVSDLSESKRCIEIENQMSDTIEQNQVEEKSIVTSFTIFSDDFDPTVSLVKANRKGVWLLQVTFLRRSDSSREFENTYVISLGSKGSDHSKVLNLVEKDIEMLHSGKANFLYYGKVLKMVQPLLSPMLKHGDQPERRGLYGLKLGRGTNHARWRYSLDYKAVGKNLSSCEQCCAQLVLCITGSICIKDLNAYTEKCTTCTNWELFVKSKLLHWKPKEFFPKDMIPYDGLL